MYHRTQVVTRLRLLKTTSSSVQCKEDPDLLKEVYSPMMPTDFARGSDQLQSYYRKFNRISRQSFLGMFASVLEQDVPQIFGIEPLVRSDVNGFDPGFLYDLGRTWVLLFKKFCIPGMAGARGGSKGDDLKKMRPSELPIYGVPCEVCTPDPCSDEPGALECQIGVVRKELWVWHDKYQGLRKEILDTCQIGLAHTENTLEYLKEESNYLPRYGAIGLSGLAGVVLGLRGGAFKRLTYGSTGAAAMASLCYPREAGEVSKEVFAVVKRNVQIGYNFIYGIKPDYLHLPGPYPPDEGADVKKPRTKLFDTMKSQFLDLTAKLTPASAPSAPVAGNEAAEKVDDEWLAMQTDEENKPSS